MPLAGQLQASFGLRLALGPVAQQIREVSSMERGLCRGIGMVELATAVQPLQLYSQVSRGLPKAKDFPDASLPGA